MTESQPQPEPLVLAPDGWREARGLVLSSTPHRAKLTDRLEADDIDHSYFVVRFRYQVGGVHYEDAFDWPLELADGQPIAFHYNPSKPAENSLSFAPKETSRLGVLVVGAAVAIILLCLQAYFGWPEWEPR